MSGHRSAAALRRWLERLRTKDHRHQDQKLVSCGGAMSVRELPP
jgi:hypothetical protein